MKKNQLVCPWQASSILTSSIRKVLHDPQRILSPHLAEGMVTMDIGCGIGFFTIPMAGIVGKSGDVIAVDMQVEMLEGLKKYADKAGTTNITRHKCAQDSLCVEKWNGTIEFALVFFMLHEVPDTERLIKELYDVLSEKGKLLFVEPVLHVCKATFQNSVDMITKSGFKAVGAPEISMSRTVLFTK